MVKVQNHIATREPLPSFLQGLLPESLVDLSWTAESEGVRELAWWPEENADGELAAGMRWGAELLTVDAERQVVVVTHEIVPLSAEEISAMADALRPGLTASNNAQYEAAIAALTADYPAAEIATWERQRAEAVAWGADHAAATPWIDIAAAARGLERDEYLARTLDKVTAFASVSAYLTGRRQGIDDQLRAASSAEQLAAVLIDYTLPGA
ncbi:hypothetical protein [Pseudomonas fluorescens]|uniref:DUF4376 domain-containing protein n=1 Tax=Pseudomonas fluorescens TaxID=294 RepID=A0A5E7ETR7_PSEFL|nr:hypothetical protein [Pseudomonas fluorescens]VVO30295.1 hypothetical protein PS723_04934 [Pseudomonas fluorescens]